MVLSPVEIHDKDFDHKFRGYDRDQVDKFLSQVVQDYDLALQKNSQLEKELTDMKEQLKYFTDMKDALNQSILVAQNAADKVKSSAEQEAQVIIEESQKKARELLDQSTDKSNQILQDASDKARQVTIETDELKQKTNSFRQGLQGMLQQQLKMIDNPKWQQLADATSTSDLKQKVGMENNQYPEDNYENYQDSVSNDGQMNYNDNIADSQETDKTPDDPYTINHDQNGPTFQFDNDDQNNNNN
ncbi:DivIVA domain-containing protein [Companilactobacillus baiquanensis]|uniref:DivIVA domain-containing protein n=1 Tax=Companilactobacillus baiquanensis TaxID=2486005 RepID=A0ABW1UX51_9LACO|nr:DivIVA domain-containing protein [Companilactobacillus baiquanensis]